MDIQIIIIWENNDQHVIVLYYLINYMHCKIKEIRVHDRIISLRGECKRYLFH
jgi:hypothetical protein